MGILTPLRPCILVWMLLLGCYSTSVWANENGFIPALRHDRTHSDISNEKSTERSDVAALYNLLDRVLAQDDSGVKESDPPSSHFVLKLCDKDNNRGISSSATDSCTCSGELGGPEESTKSESSAIDHGWFCMEQEEEDPVEAKGEEASSRLVVIGTSISEISYGLGFYFRYHCNFTLGWERIGGSVRNLKLPDGKSWPTVPKPVQKQRRVPWSYLMNVCTHSYSLVWHDWESPAHGWEAFLDWASLMGINNLLALTGQEEIQYKVYQKLGLHDVDIRSWFNGPAFLTWSRGQNEYGSGIAGRLPRSWMQQQWRMQKEHILPRLKELTIVGQLPGFQGNVPIQLADIYPDSKMTKMGDTGWLDALDPLYPKIADMWMSTLMEDFGEDTVSHWYQMDGYFNGGVPPWLSSEPTTSITGEVMESLETDITSTNRKLDGLSTNNHGQTEEINIIRSNTPHDEVWYQRGVAAYTGLNRTDPDAVWSFQGFSFIGWNNSDITASWLKGFVDSAPQGKFVIIDMSYQGLGEWTKWNNASYFGSDFIWSALHNFGDTNGLKGDMTRIASILPNIQGNPSTSLVGIGATPEGIDQNPVYYEFLFDQAFHGADEPVVPNVMSFVVNRSHRRYGSCLSSDEPSCAHVSKAWQLLAQTSYATVQSVQDDTGVAHMKPRSTQFESDRFTPNRMICSDFRAWQQLIQAASASPQSNMGFQQAPFSYDLINLGREVLAQLSAPMALNFSDALAEKPLDATRLVETGNSYIHLLEDLDLLVGSHAAFLVGTWIESARKWGASGGNDCNATAIPSIQECADFYEWNARVQITTWNPTLPGAARVPGGPIDYAAKHWSGLIKDYYARRASLIMEEALFNADKTGTLNQTEVARIEATLAFQWTTSRDEYPTQARGDPLQMSVAMEKIYRKWFAPCLDG